MAGRAVEATTTPVVVSSSNTKPVGVAVPADFVTVPVNVALAPIVDDVGPVRVMLVPLTPGADHFAIRLLTLTVPKPVARSYPVVALKAGVVPPAAVAIMPNCPAVLLLQFGLPPTHATELFPFVTS